MGLVLFLAPCGSAAAESALLPGGSVVPRFKAFKWKNLFPQTDTASLTDTLLKHILAILGDGILP